MLNTGLYCNLNGLYNLYLKINKNYEISEIEFITENLIYIKISIL